MIRHNCEYLIFLLKKGYEGETAEAEMKRLSLRGMLKHAAVQIISVSFPKMPSVSLTTIKETINESEEISVMC